MNKRSGTDWERVDAFSDEDIDTSDIPPLTDDFFRRAKVRMPLNFVTMTLHVDADVLEWFKSQGDNFEQRMNAALRLYAAAHEAVNR